MKPTKSEPEFQITNCHSLILDTASRGVYTTFFSWLACYTPTRLLFLLLGLGLIGGTPCALAQSPPLKLATWNIEWLDAELNAGSVRRSQADYDRLARYVSRLDADVVALQEVDGPEAARRIFDPNEYSFFFEPGDNPQRVGFAVRRTVTVTDDPDFIELRVGNSGLRAGAVITVEVDGQPLRLMSVHLKSGCFSDPFSSTDDDCRTLIRQVPQLERWIDDQANGSVPFIIMGDFNRRLNLEGDDLWEEIDDGTPANADLVKSTEGRAPLCWNSRFSEYIDHHVLDRRAAAWLVEGSFEEMVFDAADAGFEDVLSDHCPLSVELSPTPGPAVITLTPEQWNAILARIAILEQELAELRRIIVGLR